MTNKVAWLYKPRHNPPWIGFYGTLMLSADLQELTMKLLSSIKVFVGNSSNSDMNRNFALI